MKLSLAMLGDGEARHELEKDIAEMEAMMKATYISPAAVSARH